LDVLIISMGTIVELVANVSYNGWGKCGHVAWLHVCTLYISCNIVVILVAHL
jgi:hypothetical protein